MSYYADNSQWAAAGQPTWDHSTASPAPARSGASSVNSPRERDEPAAFWNQIEEVDRALDNLVKSGKMFASMPGARRESLPLPGPGRSYPVKGMGAVPGSRPHSVTDFDVRGPQTPTNLQNFYATHRQPSRGASNEAEQIMQAKRRQAAQRERELRNYHQDQQFNRSVLSDGSSPYNSKPDRVLSPGAMSEAERRELIARQRSALYGEGPFADSPGYIDETGTPRPGLPTGTPSTGLRGPSPLNFEYGRSSAGQSDPMPSSSVLEGGMQQQPAGQQAGAGGSDRSRTNSSASPQAATPGHRSLSNGSNGPAHQSQSILSQSTNTRVSSPGGGSPPHHQVGMPGGNKAAQGSVAPIGTRPSMSGPSSANPALNKTRGTPPLSSPLNPGFTTASNDKASPGGIATSGAMANQSLSGSGADSPSVGLAGWGGRSSGWGSKSGLGAQTPVWG